jgi:MtN3 and saliva related transmembrane protein
VDALAIAAQQCKRQNLQAKESNVGLVTYLGAAAAFCTTGAFVPQILKIRKQGGEDLSYPMLFLYLTGVLLWLAYGFFLHAGAVIRANGLTSLLIVIALSLKASYPAVKSKA